VFLFLHTFAKFWPEKKNDFDLYKGFFMGENDKNLPDFEFFFLNHQIFMNKFQ
jgi:hypothetical protein